MSRLLLSLVLFAAATWQPALADPPNADDSTRPVPAKKSSETESTIPQIRLVPAQPVVKLGGRPGSDLTLTKRITLITDAPVAELLFRAGDLHQVGGSEEISAAQIQLLSTTALQNLKAKTPRDLDFKVGGLKVPGKYLGPIEILLPERGLDAAVKFNLDLDVEEMPKLSSRSGSTSIKVQVVNCLPVIDCRINDWIYPAGRAEDHTFTLDNSSAHPFMVTGAAAAHGDATHSDANDALNLDLSNPIPALPIVKIPFTVTHGVLRPDHYVGDVQLRIPGKEDPLKIPLEVNVKSGPVMPILVLVIGILIGRFINYMKNKGVPQSDLLRGLLQAQARAAQDPTNLGLLQHMFEQVRQEIDELKLDSAKNDLALINSRLTLLSRLRYLETVLTPRANENPVSDILANIKLAREQVSLGTDPQLTATNIETQVKNLQAPAAAANPYVRALEMAAAAGVRGAAPFAAGDCAPETPAKGKLRRAVSILTGHSDALRADLTLWFLRPLAWLLLIFLLVLTGFLQLYSKNASFGADLVSDYFGLLVWAAGSDVASRTLSNFKGS